MTEAPAPPPAVELVNHQVEAELAPPAPSNPWIGSSNPRAIYGARNGHAKLTWDDVREIRRHHSEGASCDALAKRYGVHGGTVRAIIRNETWGEPETNPETQPSIELPTAPAAMPREKRRRWRPAHGEPKLGALGSGSRYDHPRPPLPRVECLKTEHSPESGENPLERD